MTAIEWTHQPGTKGESWNPIRAVNRETGGVGHYCAHVSEGCRNCYAERMQGWRFNNPIRFAAQDLDQVQIILGWKELLQPLRWRAPRTIFVCSMTDLYGPWVRDHWIDQIKAVEAVCPQHTFIELTKRPERMAKYMVELGAEDQWSGRLHVAAAMQLGDIDDRWEIFLTDTEWPLPNVWAGTSVEDHDTAQARIRELQKVPAAVRWISFEPMLGPIDCTFFDKPAFWKGIHWAVAGGESGRGARPMHPDGPRWVRDRCYDAGVAFFFKQWGAYVDAANMPDGIRRSIAGKVERGEFMNQTFLNTWGDTAAPPMFRVGKKAAGRRLDGVEWTMWPEVA